MPPFHDIAFDLCFALIDAMQYIDSIVHLPVCKKCSLPV